MARPAGSVDPASHVTAKPRLAGIEAARGCAASMVVLYHAARHVDVSVGLPSLRAALQSGHSGVDIFFVLSGFIILFVHDRDIGRPARVPAYAARRLTRVFPVYWVALALTLALDAGGGRPWQGTGRVVWSALLLPSAREPVLGIAWTLQYELVFYAAFAVLILNRWLGTALFAAWLAAILAVGAGWLRLAVPPPMVSAYNLEFFFGMAAGLLVRRVGALPAWYLPAGLALFALACAAEDEGFLNGYAGRARLAFGLPATLIVSGLVRLAGTGARRGLLGRLGEASYSIYIFQFCFIGLTWHALHVTGLDRALPAAANFVVLAAVAIAGGMVMSRLVEYRLMRALRGRLARA
jgi:peptidoglycan/LPS O-acetylase OafA/YrhL